MFHHCSGIVRAIADICSISPENLCVLNPYNEELILPIMPQAKIDFPEQELSIIRGEIKRVVFCNEDTGFYILRIELPPGTKDGAGHVGKDGLLTIKVTRPNTVEGMTMEFHGHFIEDPNYGRQFIAKTAHEVAPSTTEGLIAYLSSAHFHGIGQVKARKIVKHFGEATMDVINNNIDRLIEVAGITEKNMIAIKEVWVKNKEFNEIMQFLMDHRLSAVLAHKVYDLYGQDCVSKMKANPYELSKNIRGIGFKKSDTIALSLGFATDSPIRLKACIQYVLESSENDGHCFLYYHQIISGTEEYLGFDMSKLIGDMLIELEMDEQIVVLRSDADKDRYYGVRLYNNEQVCYRKMLELSKMDHSLELNETDLMNEIKHKVGIELSEQQKAAVIGILKSGVSVLTGGPGTGKTSVTKALVEAAKYIGLKFLLCAPTGRAAKRMNDVIGHKASTIHRMLIWDPSNGGFAHNEHMLLDADCVLIDEFSMVDIHLAASLLRAIKKGAMVVFIGDPDQLPPVGAGNFFRDLINSNVIPIYTLTQIFRQGKESNIVGFSHAINKGETPIIESPLEDPDIWKTRSTDCVFIDSGFMDQSKPSRDYPVGISVRYGFDILGMIEHVYKDTLPKYYNHPKDIQVLIPMKKGPIGTIEVNKRLQQSVNPPHSGLKEIRIGDKLFRENDKVIQLTNNYNLGVVNGDIGRIVAIDHRNNQVHINYGDDRVIAYSRKDILDIDLAYAITCHKSQGSEFEFVIIPIMNQYYRMLYRQLIYTALTRAKKLAVFIGQRQSLTMAINTINSMKRQTSLQELLTGSLMPKEPIVYG